MVHMYKAFEFIQYNVSKKISCLHLNLKASGLAELFVKGRGQAKKKYHMDKKTTKGEKRPST